VKLGEAQFGSTFMGLFVGRPGSGKSIAAASWYKEGPVYIFDLDGRYRSLMKMYGWDQKAKDNINFDTYPTDDFPRIEQKINDFERSLPYRTIIFDGVTVLAQLLINYSIALRGVEGSGREGKGRKIGIIEMTAIEDFGVEARGMYQILDAFKDLALSGKCNVIFNAHIIQWREKVGDTGREEDKYQLVTAGKKVAGALDGYFDEVYYFRKRVIDPEVPPDYECFTQGGEAFPGKSALHLPTKIVWTMKNREAPTFYDIILRYIGESKGRGF
jgi:hypothetical protein